MLILGTKESATFNLVVTVVHLILVVFIIIAGFIKADPSNMQPLAPVWLERHLQRRRDRVLQLHRLSTPSPRRAKKSRIRKGTCRLASWARW